MLAALLRPLALAAAGALTALAFAPVDLTPALFAMAGLLLGVRSATTALRAALAGWLFAFGFHVAGLYWISNALTVNGDQHLWLIPFAAAGLPAFLALFTAAAAGLAKALVRRFDPNGANKRSGLGEWLLLAALLGLAEWLRGHVLTGFPWNLPAYAWDGVPAMLQAASVVGAYGLSLLTLIAATAPALLIDRSVPRRDRALAVVLVTAGTLAVGVWGGDRLARAEPGLREDVIVRIVQGNVPQRDKWNPALRPGHIRRYLELSAAARPPTRRVAGLPRGARPTLVVWPETAVAFLIDDDSEAFAALAEVVPTGGALIFGAPRISRVGLRDGSEARVHNSVLTIGPGGDVRWVFDKHHLVPFGEYVPFRELLPVDRIVPGSRDFTPGPGLTTLSAPGVPPVSPLVCYEVIFPGDVVAARGPRPEWLLNLTNDAWYGRSSGPYQHLAIARMRAIEEGLPLVRAANTGVSAVVDAYGRVLARLELGRTGTIDSPLPMALQKTAYSTYGDVFFFLASLIVLSISCALLASLSPQSREK